VSTLYSYSHIDSSQVEPRVYALLM